MKTKKTNLDLILGAKDDLNGKWGIAIAAFLIIYAINMGLSYIPYVGSLASLIIAGAVAMGISVFTLAIARKQEVHIEQIFSGFNRFFLSLGTYWLFVGITLVVALATAIPVLIFFAIFDSSIFSSSFSEVSTIVPVIVGIFFAIPIMIVAIMYAMVFFILADNPNIGIIEAFTQSRKMMNGYKWKYLGMVLWSLLFVILGCLLVFVGLLFVIPVLYVTYAKFYEDIKENTVIE